MKLLVNSPTPWPNWQAPVSTRKLADHHGARGGGCTRKQESPAMMPRRAGIPGVVGVLRLSAKQYDFWRRAVDFSRVMERGPVLWFSPEDQTPNAAGFVRAPQRPDDRKFGSSRVLQINLPPPALSIGSRRPNHRPRQSVAFWFSRAPRRGSLQRTSHATPHFGRVRPLTLQAAQPSPAVDGLATTPPRSRSLERRSLDNNRRRRCLRQPLKRRRQRRRHYARLRKRRADFAVIAASTAAAACAT